MSDLQAVGWMTTSGQLVPTTGVAGTIAITAEVSQAIRAAGFDPSMLDQFRWPIGASGHGEGLYLIHEGDIPTDVLNGESLRFRVGNIIFDAIHMIETQPVLLSENNGVVYVIRVGDEREHWRDLRIEDNTRFNVHTNDKAVFYNSSLDGIDFIEWTPRTALESLLAQHESSDSLVTAEWKLPATGTPEAEQLDDSDYLRDLDVSGWRFGDAVDCILSGAGYVLLAFTALSEEPESGFRYIVDPVSNGQTRAIDNVDTFANDLLGGGIFGQSQDDSRPSTVLGKGTVLPSTFLDLDVPSSVTVHFPTALESGAGFQSNKEEQGSGQTYVTDRWHTVTTAAGIPQGVTGTGGSVAIVDVNWAIVDAEGSITNDAELTARADLVAARYYDRYRSGAGNILFRDTLRLASYSGAQMMIWIVNSSGVYTRVSGKFDHRLLGHGYLSHNPEHLTTGGVRALQRADGKTLLDAPTQSGFPFMGLLEDNRFDSVNAIDDRQWYEAGVSALQQWERLNNGRDSTGSGVGATDFDIPARHIGDHSVRSGENGRVPVMLFDHADADGNPIRLFQYLPFFPVYLTLAGGSDGDATMPPSYEYTLRDRAGGTIIGNTGIEGQPLQPEFRLMSIGPHDPAPNNSTGMGYYKGGNLRLYFAPEVARIGGCG